MAGLNFDITGDNSNFLRRLEEARTGIASTSKQIEKEGTSIEAMFGRMAKGAAALGAGFTAKEIVSNIVRVRGEFQQLEVAFNTMLGSEEKANALMQQLVKTAATTPFDLQSVANGAKQLLAYGTSAEAVNGTLVQLGDIAAGLSIPLNDLVWLYGTTMTQGRLFTQDFRQFQSRGIPLADELAKQFGVTKDKVGELVTAGKVGFPEVQKAIAAMTSDGGKFGGLMEAQSKTITGQMSNIEDSISTMYNNIGKSSEGVINEALSGVSYLIANYEQVGKIILELAVTYGMYKAVLMSVAAYQSMAVGVTYAAEIAELSKLIPLKQQSANQDIIAAVNSGKLTQAKAEQVIALRIEIAAKIQSLQATEAQTKVEYASAMASYKVATQRMLLAKQNMAIAQSQMSIAIKSGTADEIAAAKKNAQTASLELNNASVAKNTTHKSLNIAATNSKSASEALNTLETGKNSVAQTVNTTSTNILTVAKTKLAAASKALGLSMLANPYVLAAAAVVGLGYGIYKLITYQTDAEKAQSKLNDTVKEFNSQTASENAEIDRLFDKLRNTNKETSNYQKTKDEIIKKYSSYLEGLNQEISTLNDVEAAYRSISVAARQAAADRAITKATQEAQDGWAENRGSVIDKLKSALTSGGKMTDGAAEAFIETINRELKETGKLSDETTKKIEKYNYTITHPETGEIIDSGNSVSWAVDALKKNDKVLDDLYNQINSKFGANTNEYENLGKNDIDAYIKGFENALAKFKNTGNKQTVQLKTGWVTFGSEEELELQLNKLKEVKDSFDKDNSTKVEQKSGIEWLSSYKKQYEEAEKAYNDFLKSKKVMSDTDRDNELKRLKELRDTAKTTYESKGGSTSSDNKQENQSAKLREEQEKYNLLLNKQALDQSRSAEDLQTQVDQARINAMDEGSEKTIAQMNLDHQKEIETLKRNREDYLQKKIEAEKAIFEADPSNKGKSFDSSTVSLSKDEKGMFKNLLESTISQQGNELAAYYEEALSKYQDYAEKRLAAQKKFQQERDVLVKAGASKESLDENDYQRDETLKAIDNEFSMREDSFKAWADNIADLSLEKLRVLLVQAERELERSEFLNPKDPKLAGQRAKVTSLKNTISEKSEETNILPDKRNQKEWQDLYKTLSKVETEFEEIGDTVGGTAGEIISAAGAITTSTLKMIDGIVSLSDSSAWAISSTATAAEKAIKAVEKASVILAIIGAAMKIASEISQMITGESQEEKMKRTVDYYNKIVDIYDKIIDKQKESIKFGYGFASIQAATKAMDELNKRTEYNRKIADVSGKAGISFKDYGKDYDRLADELGLSKVGMINGFDAAIDTSELSRLTGKQLEYIRDNYKELWAGLRDEQKNSLQAIIDAEKEGKEIIEEWQEAITGISYDSFYTEFIDTLSDMDSSAEDMANNFGEYLKKSILAAMVAKEFQGEIDNLYEMWAAAGKEESDGGIDITKQEAEDLQKRQKELTEAMIKRREEMEKTYGWESSESSSQDSTQKGFAAMSQDTGNELNGRFTALQISNEEIKNTMLLVLGNLSALSATSVDNNGILSDMRNLAVMSNSYLEDIAGFQKKIVGILSTDLGEIKQKIKNM